MDAAHNKIAKQTQSSWEATCRTEGLDLVTNVDYAVAATTAKNHARQERHVVTIYGIVTYRGGIAYEAPDGTIIEDIA